MFIQITDKFAIGSDSLSWHIKQKNKRGWTAISWHTSLESATTSLYDRVIRLSDAASVKDASEVAGKALQAITEGLTAKMTKHKEKLTNLVKGLT